MTAVWLAVGLRFACGFAVRSVLRVWRLCVPYVVGTQPHRTPPQPSRTAHGGR